MRTLKAIEEIGDADIGQWSDTKLYNVKYTNVEGKLIDLGDFKTLNSYRVFSPYIYVTLRSAYCVSCNCHSFDYCMRIAFQYAPVHECARVSLIGVAYHVLDRAGGAAAELPLAPRGKARAPASRAVFFLPGFFAPPLDRTASSSSALRSWAFRESTVSS